MTDNEHEKLAEQIKDGINHIDRLIPDRTPDINYFKKLVVQVEEKKQEKIRKELILFIISAVIVLSIETFTFSRSLALFATIQISAAVSLPFSILIWKKRQNRQVKEQ